MRGTFLRSIVTRTTKSLLRKTGSRTLAIGALLSLAALAQACGAAQHPDRLDDLDRLRERAARLPNDASAQRDLAIAELLHERGDPKASTAQLERALRLAPHDELVHWLTAAERHLHGASTASAEACLRTLEAARSSSRPDAMRIAEMAASMLTELIDAVPSYPELVSQRALSLLESPGGIGLPARFRLGELLIELAYRRGESAEVERIAALLGCPTSWRIAGPYGDHPLLDFDRQHEPLRAGPMQRDYDLGVLNGRRPTRVHAPRGCQLDLGGGPSRSGGTSYAKTSVRGKGGELVLRIATVNAIELYLDGEHEPRVRIDRRRETGGSITFHTLTLEPGEHELTLKLSTRHPQPTVSVALLHGSLAQQDPEPTADAKGGLLGAYLAAATATVRGDAVGAREALGRWEHGSPLILALKVGATLSDPLRSADFRRDESRRLLRELEARDPRAWLPALQLARFAAVEGRDLQAIASLRRDVERWPELLSLRLSLSQMLLARGWDAEAARHAEQARAAFPGSCAALEAALSIVYARDRAAEIESLIDELVRCDARRNHRFRWLVSTRRWQAAKKELERIAALEPPQTRAQMLDALLQVERNREGADVEALLQELTSLEPRSSDASVALADRLLARGDARQASTALRQALRREPTAMQGHRDLLRHLEGEDVFEGYRQDGLEVVGRFEASKRHYEDPEVLVLDYSVVRIFEDRSVRELTHTIHRLQSEEAIDARGEVEPPEGAELLRLRTIKADGSTHEPDPIAGKESFSLPSLAVGDYIELEYVRSLPPAEGMAGSLLGDRFFFQSYELPFDHSELVLLVPKAIPLVFDPRGAAPRAVETPRGELREIRFKATEKAALSPEPLSVAEQEHIPSIRWGHGATWELFIDGLRGALADRDPVDPEAVALAESIAGARAKVPPRQRVQRLYRWVVEHIEEEDEFLGLAPAMLIDRKGSRARVLRYLLRLAGLPAELALVRGFGNDATKPLLVDEMAYDRLILRVALPNDELFLAPQLDGLPFDYLIPPIRGQEGITIAEGAKRFAVPTTTAEDDLRTVVAEVALQRGGSASVTVVETYRGVGAYQWRHDLESIPAATRMGRFQEGYVSRLLPGATLKTLDIEGLNDAEAPLLLRYRFEVASIEAAQGGARTIATLFPSSLGASLAQSSERRTTLLLGAPTATDMVFKIVPRAGSKLVAPADAEAKDGRQASFSSRSRFEGDALIIERRLRLARMRIPRARYPAFAAFCREVDRLEARPLTVRTK